MDQKFTVKQRGPLIIEIGQGEKAQKKVFLGGRVGLSWPSALNPGGYFVIVGQEAKKLITGENPLMMLSEFSGLTMNSLFVRLFDEMAVFGAMEIFADLSDRYESYVRSLDLYKRKYRDQQMVTLKEAPFAGKFILGDQLLTHWSKEVKDGLIIPKDTELHRQIRSIQDEEVTDEAYKIFFAMNAFFLVLGAFETSSISPKEKLSGTSPIPVGAWT